jgi:tetratricopeptide (TPR) repeat protein
MDDLGTQITEELPAGGGNLRTKIELDRERAGRLLAELLEVPRAVRLEMALTLKRFHSVGLARLLADEALARRATGEGLAELALGILDQVDASWRGLANHARARAWAAIGNCRRLRGDRGRAEDAFFRASFHLAEEADPLEEAHFYRLRAQLLRDQGNRDEAIALQRRALKRLDRYAAPADVAEALLELAGLHLDAEDRAQCLAALQKGCEVLRRNDQRGG